MYGKQTETAIAAVSYLAELWRGVGTRRVSAADIADARGLQRPFVAKLLSALSQAGIVSGSPGPGGGYALAKSPAEIRLRDVWLVFERPEPARACPFGGGQCGVDRKCPIHQRIQKVHDAVDALLDDTTFDVFEGSVSAPATGNVPGQMSGQMSGQTSSHMSGQDHGKTGQSHSESGPLGGRLARLRGTNGTNGANGAHQASGNGHG